MPKHGTAVETRQSKLYNLTCEGGFCVFSGSLILFDLLTNQRADSKAGKKVHLHFPASKAMPIIITYKHKDKIIYATISFLSFEGPL